MYWVHRKMKMCLVYEEHDRSFYMGLGKSRDESLLMIDLAATENSDCLVLDANSPYGEFKRLIPREETHIYDIDKLGDEYVIYSNWQAKNFRIFTADHTTISNKACGVNLSHIAQTCC